MDTISEILEYQNDRQEYVFLKSFLENIVKMPVDNITDVHFTQPKSGYKDLYIQFKDGDEFKRIIIVDRIEDIPDEEHQLDRYVYNAVVMDFNREIDFETWISDPAMHNSYEDEYDNIRLVYMTKDGTKYPGVQSLKRTLKANILPSYVPVSLDKDIQPWLNTIQQA